MKKLISILTLCTVLVGNTGSFCVAAETEETPYEVYEINMPEIAFQPEEYVPIEHDETVKMDTSLLIEPEDAGEPAHRNNIAAYSSSDDAIWKQLYAQQFGDAYLTPYKQYGTGEHVSGYTNRLTIDETDLTLEGKNGLNLEIKRHYDNQDYSNIMYSYKDSVHSTLLYRYVYSFTNISDKTSINIGFCTEDDFYTYMYEDFYLSSLPRRKYKDNDLVFYAFEDVYSSSINTSANGKMHFKYNPNVSMQVASIEKSINWDIEERKLYLNKEKIGFGWSLSVPEVFLYRDYYDKSSGKDYVSYSNNYKAAFKGMQGEICTFDGSEKVKIKDGEVNFQSSFYPEGNNYLTAEAFYADQILENSGIVYNFVITDNRGLTYYFYSTGVNAGTHSNVSSKQKLYIKAVRDRYDNMIQYWYTDNYSSLSKIIDTCGREVNINIGGNVQTISYTDNGETKTITYTRETLTAAELPQDSNLKYVGGYRLKVTNEIGETTCYDSRAGEVVSYYHTISNTPMTDIATPTNLPRETSSQYNIERITYPTGAQKNYHYTCLYTVNRDIRIRRGFYAVDGIYEYADNQKINEQQYTFSNSNSIVTVECNNLSAKTLTKSRYDSDGRCMDSSLQSSENLSGYISDSYTYDQYGNVTKHSSSRGNSDITETASYLVQLPGCISTWDNGKTHISYTYHSINGRTSEIPSGIYYYKYDKSSKSYVVDYVIKNELTEDNKAIEYSKTLKNDEVIAQKKFEYDSCGEIIAEYEWIGDTNGDGVLDMNDDVLVLKSENTITEDKTKHIINRKESVHDADGEETLNVTDVYDYDVHGNPTKHTAADGSVTEIRYDDINRPVLYTYPNGGTKSVEYNTAQKHVIVTDVSGLKTKRQYNSLGDITAEYFYHGASATLLNRYVYDNAQRLIEKHEFFNGEFTMSNRSQKETYTYDAIGRTLTKEVYFQGKLKYTENYTYTKNTTSQTFDTLKTTIGADGTKTAGQKETCDRYGRLIKTELTADNQTITTSKEYDIYDNVVKETDALGNSTVYEFDVLNNQISTADALGNTCRSEYDMAGRKISDTDALGNKTSYTYDEMNRLVKTESPFETDTSVTKYYYDRVSNLAKEKIKNNAAGADESYKEKDYAYDIMHNNVGVTIKGTYEDNSVQYEYNTAGQLTKMITGISRIDENIPETASVTSYEYDGFGYVSTITDATGKSSLYTNYADGKTWITDDRKNNKYINEYDLFGLKERCIYGDINGERRRERQLYEYNDIGQLLRKEIYVNDELTDSAAYEYDGFGRLTKETMNGISNNYTYDLNSNVTGHSISGADSDTQSVTYAYDAMNRITGISANSISRCSYEYDANGNMILKNTYGAISQITYNNANLPVSMVNKYAATEYNSYSFVYNVDGNRINETDSLTGISKSYQYDSLDRLQHEEVSKNGTVFITEYGYDLSGNRTDQYNSNGDIMSYDYNKNNCLTGSSTMTDETGEIQEIFDYDANGNMESRQIIDGTDVTVEQYIYDASNRLIEAEKDGLDISYEYNADGLRKSKTVNGVRTEYAWDRGNMCLERTNAGTDLAADRQYVYGADGIAFSANDYTYVKNIHGDVTRVNDFLMGTQTNAYEYNSFGEITEMSETYENPFRYCGEYYDTETGWVYLRNRYYNPETGRFISEDPARDGSNWYTYCKNNPVTFVDPWGLSSIIFVSNEMREQAKIRQEIYKNRYNTSCYIVSVGNAKEFAQQWNTWFSDYLINEEIDAIEIISHGGAAGAIGKNSNGTAYATGFLYFGQDPNNERLFARDTNDMNITDAAITWLNPISSKVNEVNINGCNSANPDVYNVVYGLMQKVDSYNYVGFDGGATWNPQTNDHERGNGEYGTTLKHPFNPAYYVAKYQGTWWKYVDKKDDGSPVRYREGKRWFQGR